LDDRDRERFIATLDEACGKTGWQVHALCLMGNHFHGGREAEIINAGQMPASRNLGWVQSGIKDEQTCRQTGA
jgi:hypothetical protein